MKLRIGLVVLIGSLFSAACGSSTDGGGNGGGGGGSSGGGTCGKAGRTGDTECGTEPCHAGAYCDAEYYDCVPGCLSDNNCAENQYCVFCGSDPVGVCRPCDQSSASVCGSSGSGSMSGCTRNTTLDQPECFAGGLPPKAYVCPSDQEPSQPDCVQGVSSSGVWCCPT
jgi:hypothetical protein